MPDVAVVFSIPCDETSFLFSGSRGAVEFNSVNYTDVLVCCKRHRTIGLLKNFPHVTRNPRKQIGNRL